MPAGDARIGLLSTEDDPLLGHVLEAFAAAGASVRALILDERGWSARDLRIFSERTAGRIERIPLERAIRRVPVQRVRSHSSTETAALVRDLALDVLGNAGTPRILGAEILAAPSLGIVNCHPGLLPRFRGRTCVEWAIYLDEPVGITAHFMTLAVDEGPIIEQRTLAFSRSDDYVAVRTKVYLESVSMLAATVTRVARERIHPGSLAPQGAGTFFDVIDPDRLRVVRDKLARGVYAYQRDG